MSLMMENAHAKIGCGDPGDPIEFSAFFPTGSNYLSAAVSAASTREAVIDYKFKNVGGDGTERLHISTNLGFSGQYFYAGLAASDQFRVLDGPGGSETLDVFSMGKFRDKAAHYNPHIRINTAELVASDRVQLWMGGHRVILTGTFPAQNADMNYLGGNQTHYIGCWAGSPGTPGNGDDTILSDVVYEDSITPQLTDFGRFNADGHWVNKTYSGSAVYNLPFTDPINMGLNLTGADFTVNGAIEQSVDTPGLGNFATLDPNAPTSPTSYSGGNLEVNFTNVSDTAVATIRLDPEKLTYFEVVQFAGTENRLVTGILDVMGIGQSEYPGLDDKGWAFLAQTGDKLHNGVSESYGDIHEINDVVGVAFDGPNGALYFRLASGWMNGGDPESGVLATGAAYSGLVASDYVFAVASTSNIHTVDVRVNFGQEGFSFPIPSGYTTLNTQELSCPEILDPSKYYQREQTIGGGDLSTNWNPLVDDTLVLTNRTDSAEEWRVNMIIGGVQVNPFDTADNSGEIVGEDGFTFNSGGAAVGADVNYQGTRIDRAFRCTAQSGMALVTINHVNGVPTVVNHSAGGVADEATFFPVSGGDRREYLRSQGGDGYRRLNGIEFTSDPGFITGNMVNQFTVDGSLPTDTYRVWIRRSVPQFSKSCVYEGNNDPADGSFVPLDFEAELFMGRKLSGGSNYFVKDNLGSNPNVQNQFLNSISSPGVDTWDMDFYSNGVKWFDASQSTNDSGLYAGFAIAKTPIKFANAV